MKALVRKTIDEMAEETYRLGTDASGPELSDLVTKIMEAGGYKPEDVEVRKAIGKLFRNLRGIS